MFGDQHSVWPCPQCLLSVNSKLWRAQTHLVFIVQSELSLALVVRKEGKLEPARLKSGPHIPLDCLAVTMVLPLQSGLLSGVTDCLVSDVALLPLSRTGHWALPYSVGNSCTRQPCGGWRQRSCWLQLCCNAGACPPCPPGSSWVLGEREGGWPAWRAFSQVGDQAVQGGVGGDSRLMLSAYKIIVVPKF